MDNLSREDILKMPAGREMDALIAEKVMGHEVNRDVVMFSTLITVKESYSEGFTTLAHYSTDIYDAWEVVKKLDLTDFLIEKAGDHYCVNLVVESACAETAPLAISRAALLAVMDVD